MIRLKPLPPIALTNLQPAFYDVESVTAIEMVSKLYSYLQELVNDYNSFVTEVNNNIDAFEKGITKDFECFKKCIIKTMNDYIETIDTKINLQDLNISNKFEEQDQVITDAVNYMKNNIIQTATNIINQAIENGELQISITYDEPTEELNIIVTREDDNNGI